jgi:hypothetical protein
MENRIILLFEKDHLNESILGFPFDKDRAIIGVFHLRQIKEFISFFFKLLEENI